MKAPQSAKTKVKLKRFNSTWWLGEINAAGNQLSVLTRNDESSNISLVQVLIADSKVRDGVADPSESALNIFLTAVQASFPDVSSVTTQLTDLAPGNVVEDIDSYQEI